MKKLGSVLALAGLFALVGCSAGSMPASGSRGEDVSSHVGESAGAVPQAEPSAGDSPLSPQLARSAEVSLRITDVMAAAQRLRELASAAGGQVVAENLVLDAKYQSYSTVVISVDADKLDSTLTALAEVGTVESRVINSEDVTTQVADVNARVAALNASIQRLQELSKKAGSVEELVQVEAELSNRIAERDSMVAQQKWLSGRVAQSQITIQLITPDQASPLQTTGFVGGLLSGWKALLATGETLLTVVGALLPFAAVALLVLIPLLVWRRRVRARKRQPVPQPPHAAE